LVLKQVFKQKGIFVVVLPTKSLISDLVNELEKGARADPKRRLAYAPLGEVLDVYASSEPGAIDMKALLESSLRYGDIDFDVGMCCPYHSPPAGSSAASVSHLHT